MKTITLGALAVAGAALGALFTGAPAAHADPQSAVDALHSHGFYNDMGDRAMLSVAYGVCQDLALHPINGEQAAYNLWLRTGIDALDDARQFVVDSVLNLCPEYSHPAAASSTAAPAPTSPRTDFGPRKL